MLGDSVYTESLEKEINFAKLLPKKMCEEVLKFIWKIYYNKITILQDESLNFFVSMMKLSNFRRCVFDEIIEGDNNKISIVYSGQIGCYVVNMRN